MTAARAPTPKPQGPQPGQSPARSPTRPSLVRLLIQRLHDAGQAGLRLPWNTSSQPTSGFRSQGPPSLVGRPRLCLSQDASEVGAGLTGKESTARWMGVTRGLATQEAPGEVFAEAQLQD